RAQRQIAVVLGRERADPSSERRFQLLAAVKRGGSPPGGTVFRVERRDLDLDRCIRLGAEDLLTPRRALRKCPLLLRQLRLLLQRLDKLAQVLRRDLQIVQSKQRQQNRIFLALAATDELGDL